MFQSLLSVVCAIIFGLFSLFDFDNKDQSNHAICIVSFVICIASIMFYCVGITKCEKSEWVDSQTPYSIENIISLNDNNLTNGRFVANKVNSAIATLFYTEDNYRVEWYTKNKK